MRRPLSLITIVALCCALWPLHAADAAPLGGPVLFEPEGETVLQLQGRGSYRGSLEVRRSGGSMTVVNTVDLESYVLGIAEVPPSWPMEALKAQAVAARTYALWEADRGIYRSRGYDICGTVACQVYTGVLSERRRGGERWMKAVRSTAGEVLMHDGEPILARYHASSGGRTLANETVYPSSGPRPYLPSVDDEPDSASPLHRWTVRFTYDEMREILRVAFDLSGVLETIESDQADRRLTIKTERGELEMNIVRFRREVSEAAHKMFPQRFPSERNDGRLLPLTLPSSRFDVTRTDDGFRIDGRGYGHGVGMSQWGAKGRADRGDDYREILAAYYGGLEPQEWEGRMHLRVGVASGMTEAKVFGDGPFTVRDGRTLLASSTLGTWRTVPGPGRTLALHPPTGHELPLVLSAVSVPAEVKVEDRTSPVRVEVRFVVPKAAQVATTLKRGDETVARTRETYEAGPALVKLSIPQDRVHRRDSYTLNLAAFDGNDTVRSSSHIVISKPGSRAPLLVVIALLALLAAAFAARRRIDAEAALSGQSETIFDLRQDVPQG